MSERLVGRSEELAVLDGALARLEDGPSGAVELCGEPGIGKSRLLDELATRAAERGHLVLTGRASELERDLPFWIFVDALDEYLRSLDPPRGGGIDERLRSELARVFPSLAEFATDSETVLHERYRAHQAVRDLLERLAAGKPLVLVLDDVHWADPASVELLGALLRRPPQARVLLALAVRPRQARGRLNAALENARHAGTLDQLVLGPLSAAEADELIGDSIDSSAARTLYEESGGNPFYLEQLARLPRHTNGRGRPPLELATRDPHVVPLHVADSLAEELDVLSPEARGLLNAAAVVGDPFEPELAAAAAGLSLDKKLPLLDELVRRDFVRRTDVPRRFRFRHPIVRKAVYEEIEDGWRLAAHARVAEALAARGERAAVLAHHVEQSARRGDAAAIEVLRNAAHASARRAPESAARWYRAAVRLLSEQRAGAQRIELLSALAGVLAGVGRFAESRAALLELLELVPADAVALRVKSTAACAAVEHLLGLHREAHARLASTLEQLPDPASADAAALMIDLAVDAYYVNEYERMREYGVSALQVVRPLGDRPVTAAASAVVAAANAYLGRAQEAEAYRAEAAGLVDSLSDDALALRLDAAAHLGTAEVYLDHYEDGARHLARGRAVGRATGQGELFPLLTQMEGVALFTLGRLHAAAEALDDAIEGARLLGNAHSLGWTLFNRSWTALLAGDLDTALNMAEESVELFGGLESPVATLTTTYAHTGLGTVLLEKGEPERCLELLLAAGGGADLPLIPATWRIVLQEVVARAWIALERQDEAELAAERAERQAAELGLPLGVAMARRARAAVALAAGDSEAAAQAALASAATAEAIDARVEAARARTLAGRALLAAGDRAGAAKELERAFTELDACGAARFRDEAARELRRLGRRFHPGRAARAENAAASLTRREREIAEFVRDRKTNREIAGELFLSEKTVETHLHHIFDKLGVSSRTSVARALESQRPGRHS